MGAKKPWYSYNVCLKILQHTKSEIQLSNFTHGFLVQLWLRYTYSYTIKLLVLNFCNISIINLQNLLCVCEQEMLYIVMSMPTPTTNITTSNQITTNPTHKSTMQRTWLGPTCQSMMQRTWLGPTCQSMLTNTLDINVYIHCFP